MYNQRNIAISNNHTANNHNANNNQFRKKNTFANNPIEEPPSIKSVVPLADDFNKELLKDEIHTDKWYQN